MLAVAQVAPGIPYMLAIYLVPFIAATWLSLQCESLKFVLSRILKSLLKNDGARLAHGYPLADPMAGGDREGRLDI
jgi:hypothetical protein